MKKSFWALLAGVIFCFVLACSSEGSNPDDGGTGTSDDDGTTVVDKSGNLLVTGASANDLLSNSNFDALLIEVGFVTGFRPTVEAMTNFENFLRERTFKQNIQILYNELPSPGEETLTLQEIADLEEANRTAYNEGSTLAVYIYFADSPSDGDDEEQGLVTLGAVYRNTSMVIFERTIQTLAGRSLTITDEDVETATLNHEFGHLFGLVDLGTVPVNDHEDPDAVNHCNVEGCLMRAELQFGDSSSSLTGKSGNDILRSACSISGHSILHMLQSQNNRALANVPGLDAECILDLQNNGGR